MPPDTIWSDHLHKLDTKLSVRGVEWKNLMNECLMATQIKRNECFDDRYLNPNTVMNFRHQMAKECFKKTPIPHCQIQSEAMKLIREENNRKLLRIKEENLIRKEIGKLQKFFEYHDTMTSKCLEIDEKKKHVQQLPNITSKVVKFWVLKVNKKYRAVKIKQEEIPKSTAEITKTEAIPTKMKCLENKNNEMRLRKFDECCDESFMKSLEPGTKKKEITKMELKPLLPKIDTLNRMRVKRAWEMWRVYTLKQKIKQKKKKNYVDKIEEFLKRLQQRERETKTKLRITSCKQESKMFPQRAKTAINDKEREEKLRTLMQEVKKSQTEVLLRLRTRRSESSLKNFPNPRFLSEMEERHEERLKRWQNIQERKQKLKEEKESMQKLEEEEKRKKIKLEKQRKIEELKEKQRVEKEKKEEQRKKREKLKRDLFLANSHYQKFLLRSYGLRPWIQLMKLADAQYEQAVGFYNRLLLLSFRKWRTSIEEQVEKKRRLAEQFFNRILVKRCWVSWVELRKERISLTQVAVDWNDFKITEKMFDMWMLFTEKEQLEYLNKKEAAESHCKRKLKMKYLKKLRSYPVYKAQERETEIRKLKWRQKVKEILPDYQPIEMSPDW